MKVMWLASWFPNRTSPFNGDFIERHAIAAAAFAGQLFVIAVVKDDAMEKGSVEIEKKQQGNLTVYTVYYGKGKFSPAEKILSFRKYFSLQKKIYRQIEQEHGRPDIVHVQVPMKAGLFAQYLEKKYGIPYIVTEHWAGYDPLCRPNILNYGRTFIKLNNLVLKGAKMVLPVSDYLGGIINEHFIKIHYTVVPNVVNTELFFPVPKSDSSLLQLIHVSTMGYQKNMEAVVEALVLWKQQGAAFKLNCYGPTNNELVKLVQRHSLQRQVVFHGEVVQPELARAMQQADGLILYSRYETFGCVLIEANACGVPVIVSDLPVFHEFITEGFNGIFVKPNDPAALATALEKFAASNNKFDQHAIANRTKERFGYAAIGKQLTDVYRSVLAAVNK